MYVKYQEFAKRAKAEEGQPDVPKKPQAPRDWSRVQGPSDVGEKDDFDKFTQNVLSDMTISCSPLGLIFHGYIIYVLYSMAAYCPFSSPDIPATASTLGYITYPFRLILRWTILPSQTNPFALVSCPTRPWTFHHLAVLTQFVFYAATFAAKVLRDRYQHLDRFFTVYLLDIVNGAVWLPWFVVRGAQMTAKTAVVGLYPRAWRSTGFWGSWAFGGTYTGPILCWWLWNFAHRSAVGLYQWEAAQEVALADEVRRRLRIVRARIESGLKAARRKGGKEGLVDDASALAAADPAVAAAAAQSTTAPSPSALLDQLTEEDEQRAQLDDGMEPDDGGMRNGGWDGVFFRLAQQFASGLLLLLWEAIRMQTWGVSKMNTDFEKDPVTAAAAAAAANRTEEAAAAASGYFSHFAANASSAEAAARAYVAVDVPRWPGWIWAVGGVMLSSFLYSLWISFLTFEHRLVVWSADRKRAVVVRDTEGKLLLSIVS
ncbi:hypothetical protein DFJ73DRAFT_92837 [Zopfochytrium polystomum]|nr:hypothetical protein DFJ73DRAFT_92837 [Zopfochytrium polystomum]